MPRFGFVGDEELPSTDSPSKQKMANTPSKHVAVPGTKPASEAKVLPPEDDADLESLADEEAACEEDPDAIQETRDAAAEVDRKGIGSRFTVKAPDIETEEDQRLLEEVATNWTCGKACSQTGRCTSAIRNCLLQGMKQMTIAHYVAYHAVQVEDQAVEFARIKDCAYRVNKSLKKSGNVSPRGDALLQKSVEAAMASLNISSEAKDTNDSMKIEHHWMMMWENAAVTLKKLRKELKDETDEEVMDELKSDIDALKKKKDEWAVLLGMKEKE